MRRPRTLLAALFLLGLAREARAATLDPLFTESTFALLSAHWVSGIAWAPDGSNRLFVTNVAGTVRIIEDGKETATPFYTFPTIYAVSECGLIGMTFDPDFCTNGYIYFFVSVSSTEQQIIRLTAKGNTATDPTVIVSGLPTMGKNHDGGALSFGPDGKLYWGIGELASSAGINGDLASLAAKVSRANPDGTIPEDNPFFDGPGPNADAIWVRGFRNPYTMTMQPATGRLWVNDVGTKYEQIFVPSAGDHAGFGLYEVNQADGYLRPTIWYRTNGVDSRTLTADGSSRAGNVASFTTTAAHYYARGQKITVAGSTPASLDGTYFVASTPTPTTFTASSPGPDAKGGGGTSTTDPVGGAVLGGTFWESSSVPPAYRGNYFFGDFVSGNLMRVQLGSDQMPVSVDIWGNKITNFIDMDVGPDGDLYYTFYNGIIRKAHPIASAQGLVVTPLHRWMKEGGAAALTVRLAQAPAAAVQVTSARTGGDADVSVTAGSTLSFSTDNWSVPQVIRLAAAQDDDSVNDLSTLTIASAGLPSESVTVHVIDDDSLGIVVSSTFTLDEGTSAPLQVSLSGPPPKPVTVSVAVSAGDPDVSVTAGASLSFDASNWSTPQTVTVDAAQDPDLTDDQATLSLTGGNLPPRSVAVSVIDDDPVAPIFTSTPPLTAVINAPYVYDADATGTPTPTYAATASVGGSSIDPTSGLFTFTSAALGPVDITLTAINGINPDATQAFTVTVVADQPPTCSLTKPADGSTLGGDAEEFYGDGADDVGTTKAEFFVDDVLKSTDSNTIGHYHYEGAHQKFDTTPFPDGPHTLRMTITDTIGQTCSAVVNVTIVNNPGVGGAAGASGQGGQSGSSGQGGQSGSAQAGAGGQSGTGAGQSGSGGQSGESGQGGQSGESGQGGQGGDSGSAGAGGDSGSAGSAGASGQGGEGQAGQAGASGAGGQAASGGKGGSSAGGQGGASGSGSAGKAGAAGAAASGAGGKAGAAQGGGGSGSAGKAGAGQSGAGSSGTSGQNPASDVGGDGGCGCRAAGTPADRGPGWLAAALGLLAVRGRRKRSRA